MDTTSLTDVTTRAIDAGQFTGASFAVVVNGATVVSECVGAIDDALNSTSVDPDSLFDVASLTKPVVTATAVLQLVDAARLRLNDPVSRLIHAPQDANASTLDVTVAQLLTHTSGLPAVPPDFGDTAGSDLSDVLLRTPPTAVPGSAYTYSDCGYILLGLIVEAVAGESLDRYAADHIFAPLGMTHSMFLPDSGRSVVATTRDRPPGRVHDPRARQLGGVAGHAGLFSTASDLVCYGEAIRTGRPGFLSQMAIGGMSRSQIPPDIGAHSFGWFCQGAPLFPGTDSFSAEAFAHSGFTGCVLAIDPARELTAALLTNRVYSSPEDNKPYLAFRRRWIETLCGTYPIRGN